MELVDFISLPWLISCTGHHSAFDHYQNGDKFRKSCDCSLTQNSLVTISHNKMHVLKGKQSKVKSHMDKNAWQ